MRTMNFRLWCSHKEEWEKDEWCVRRYGDIEEIKSGRMMRPDTHILEQNTGLLDKEGIEIYEGDILGAGKDKMVCVFEAGCFQVGDGGEHASAYLFQVHKAVEIIGNIHQNPDLLESK